jgi:hypothetical protein
MSACWTPGWLIDAEVQWQLVECPVSRHCATLKRYAYATIRRLTIAEIKPSHVY